MTYNIGQIIENETYNSFAILVNEIFNDNHLGAPALPNAGYGYGQSPALITTIPDGQIIGAVEWRLLFDAMRRCATHQTLESSIVPPIPAAGSPEEPMPGRLIKAVTPQINFDSLLATLKNNNFLAALTQTGTVTGPTFSSSAAWSTKLTHTYTVDFGSWNNARYFFNSGGAILLKGTYVGGSTPDELSWANVLDQMSPLNFNYITTTPRSGGNEVPIPPGVPGFYGLDQNFKSIYLKHPGVAHYYSTNFVLVEARLVNSAGQNGLIEFRITLNDNDDNPVLKSGTTSYISSSIRSMGAITYPGSLTVTSGGFIPVP